MGMLKSSLAFLVLAFAFFFCYVMSSGSYDYFQFVQQWPPTNCKVRGKPCSKPRPLQYFTIHGLWPSNYSNPTMPSNCNGLKFEDRKVYPQLRSKLKRSWPDVESGNDTKFWESEWNKHGRCSEQTLNQMQYFEGSHDMWKSFNITNILKNASIIPNATQTWSYSDIASPIKAATKRTPLLRCKRDPKHPNKPQLLHEVVFCYDYNAIKQIDCNGTAGCQQAFSFQ
uniref:Self-incompatibility associated ribonuclease S2 n=2 Tax=Prunus pseudocerasus TaxID=151439 RepID=G8XUS8_9ROSA|nr:self-incompatibility associated ribonuclease S2 [Prunus pseudocerasus]